MDPALQARNLGSAAARKQRMQQRQLEQHLVFTEHLERKKQIFTEMYTEIDPDIESDLDVSLSIDHDSAAATPSEFSVPTPEGLSSPHPFVTLSPTVYNAMSDSISPKHDTSYSDAVLPKPDILPRMQATLTTIADWNYDRFSVFMASSDEEKGNEDTAEEDEESSSSSDDDLDDFDDLEECSPIETATPVTYISPKMRPSVVSITPLYAPIKPVSTIIKRPTVRRHVSEQMSIGDSKLFQYPNSSQETVGSTNASSQVSRSVSLASQKGSMLSRSTSGTSHSDQSHKSPKRKSSMPLLFGNNKSGHSRMSSIKKLIRSSTLGPPPSVHSHTSSFSRSPSGTALETHFEDRGASLEVIREPTVQDIKRPMTARAPAPVSSDTGTFPAPPRHAPPPLPFETVPAPSSDENDALKMKPVSKFRSRTGSFGHALKLSNSGPKRTDASAPPLPAIMIPPSTQSLDLNSFPAPPPLTPRDPRRAMGNASPLPSHGDQLPRPLTVNKKASAVLGLGLRY